MKGIDIFCASQAATAIRSTMEEITAASSSNTIQLGGGGGGGGRAIDRFNPIITDSRRRTAPLPKPPASNPGSGVGKTKKDKSKSRSNKKKNSRKAAAAAGEESGGGGGGWRCTKPGGFITPQSSTRYLLNEDKDYFLDVLSSDFDPILKLDDPNNDVNLQQVSDESCSSHNPYPLPLLPPPPPPSSPPSRSADQVVVVLRVSLHCRGCERKMRKHISRMQGVSSFNIDFAAKKVTVVGDVTPLGVLASISKVKNAQLWSPGMAGSSIPAPAVSLSNSTSKTTNKPVVADTSNENMENISRNIQLLSMK